jgi:hypothetical protein
MSALHSTHQAVYLSRAVDTSGSHACWSQTQDEDGLQPHEAEPIMPYHRAAEAKPDNPGSDHLK